jgi:uncharacterized coiled-coil DUF342 family protein
MSLPKHVSTQIDMLDTYHKDLWAEVESQLRVLRDANGAIAKLREARSDPYSLQEKREATETLARHVQTLKGRTHTLCSTIQELEQTVTDLRSLLAAAVEEKSSGV